jgi:hypothetical protein
MILFNRGVTRLLFEKLEMLIRIELSRLKVEKLMAKGVADLRVSVDGLEAAVAALPGRVPPPPVEQDLSPEIDRIDAATAAVNAIAPAAPPAE